MNPATQFVVLSVVALAFHTNKWIPAIGGLLLIRMALVVHIVKHTNRLPQIRIGSARLGKMFH